MQLNTIEDVPVYNLSLRILKFWSILRRHNWRRYVCIVPFTTVTTAQCLDILVSTEAIDAIVRNCYIAVLFVNAVLRTVSLCINRFEYEQLMDDIRLLYIDLMNSDDKSIRKMLQDTDKASAFISKMNLLMGGCSCFGFVFYPLFASTRVLPYGMYIPGIDTQKSPYYEVLFIFQVIITPMGCSMYIPFTNLIVSFILFAILMCKVLQHKLRNLKDVSNETGREVIVWCIKYQLELIKYVDTINHLITYTYLVEFISFAAMICAMLFLFLIVETVAQMIIICAYIVMIFFQSFVMYYFASELYDQSLNVAIAAYDSSWFEFDVSTQKTLKLLILRSQKPCAILIGKLYPMNLQRLQSLLNATYSYFTLLKRVYG